MNNCSIPLVGVYIVNWFYVFPVFPGFVEQSTSIVQINASALTVVTVGAVKWKELMPAEWHVNKTKCYFILPIQISFTNLVSVDEKLTYKPHPQDPEK